MRKLSEPIFIMLLFVAMATLLSLEVKRCRSMKEQLQTERRNTSILTGQLELYKTDLGQSVARCEALTLSLEQYKAYRAEDAATIDRLKGRCRSLESVVSSQSNTIVRLQATAKDTIVIRDSLPVRAVSLQCGDEWYTFKGLLEGDTFSGSMASRDSLLITCQTERQRFLGFLWYTNKVKERTYQIINRNPHCTIDGFEVVEIR